LLRPCSLLARKDDASNATLKAFGNLSTVSPACPLIAHPQADPSQRLDALRALSGTTTRSVTKGKTASLFDGVHPEDVVFSPAWPALCASLPACLVPGPTQCCVGPGSFATPSTTCKGGDQRAGVEERATALVGCLHSCQHSREEGESKAALLRTAAVLVEQLAKECVRASPVHAVQLLQALVPFLLAGPLPATSADALSACGSGVGGPAQTGPESSQGSSAHAVDSLFYSYFSMSNRMQLIVKITAKQGL